MKRHTDRLVYVYGLRELSDAECAIVEKARKHTKRGGSE